MYVLEQEQRQRAAAVEQVGVALLHVHQVAFGQLVEQAAQRDALLRADLASRTDGLGQFGMAVAQVLVGIVQQQEITLRMRMAQSSHSWTVLMMSRRLAFFAPNMLVSEAPEQPLPKLKPQPERSAKASLMASSRCAVGIT